MRCCTLLLFFSCIAHRVYAEPIHPSSPNCSHWRCGTPELIRHSNASPQLPQISAAPAAEVHLGQIDRFYTHIPEQLVKATCIAIGKHIYIYIENSVLGVINEVQAQDIAAEFDSRIYPQVHRWIGSEWRPGLDRDNRVTLLLHDVGLNNSAQDIGGYFSPTDQRPTDFNSNRREIIFADVFLLKERGRFIFLALLAHEFAHLANWYQNGGTTDESWLEEGLASFAEWAIYGNVHNIFVDGYLRDPSVSLTIGNTRDVYYGAAFMLLLYAFENHGGGEFIRELARQDLLGISGINAAFTSLDRPERFADVFQNWAVANFVNDIRRGQIFGYENLPNKRVNREVDRRVNSYPTIRADSLEDWGVRYVTFQNLPPQLEIALDGSGKGEMNAKVVRFPRRGTPAIQTMRFDENDNGRLELHNLNPTDQVLLVVTTTAAQSFRYAGTSIGNSGIVVGAPRAIDSPIVSPDRISRAVGNRAQPIQKRLNISYKLEPMRQVHLSSSYQNVSVAGNYAYAASDWGLEIFDLTVPTRPVRIGEIATPGNAQDAAVDGGIAYIADGEEGVQIIDIGSPASPQYLKTLGGITFAHRIRIANGYAYIVDSENGLLIYDLQQVRDSIEPKPVSTFQTVGEALDVWIDGRTVYLSDRNQGFQILDFEQINIPAIVGKAELIGYDFQVQDGYAYLASGDLRIVDVRDRFNPKVISTLRTPGTAANIKFQDGHVYLTDAAAGFYLIDVRNPLRPEFVHRQSVTGSAMGVDLFKPNDDTTFAYIADRRGSLHTIDVSQPSNPQWLHRYDASGEAYGLDVVQREGGEWVAFIADGRGGLKIVDIKHTLDAALINNIPIDGSAAGVRVDNGHAYIAGGEDGVFVLDVRDVNRPKTIARIPTSDPATGVEVDNGYVYVCAGDLIVIDVRDLNRVRVAARQRMAGAAYQAAIDGAHAYIAALDGGLHIYDIENPAVPRAVGSFETTGNATNVTAAENRAYVLDSRAGVQVLDATDPHRPVRIAAYETDEVPIDAQMSGEYLYLLDEAAIQIVNMRSLELVSRFKNLRFPSGLKVVGDTVYVTDLYALKIFKINEHLFELSVYDSTVFGEQTRFDEANPRSAGYTTGLGQNFPNPFNPETWIPYRLALDANVTVKIFSRNGHLVRTIDAGPKKADAYEKRSDAVYWDGRNEFGEHVANGTYFYTLTANRFSATRKMAIVR